MSYTKGEWTKRGKFNINITKDVLYCLQAQAGHGCKAGELEANAQLIATAPELLEACKEALEYLEGLDSYESIPLEVHLQEVINRAERK